MITKIVAGNNFSIKVSVVKAQYETSGSTWVDFDIVQCKDVHVNLICTKHQTTIPLEWSIDESANNIILCKIEGRWLHSGAIYGLEITGFDSEDNAWRYYDNNLFAVVNTTAQSYMNADLMDNPLLVNAKASLAVNTIQGPQGAQGEQGQQGPIGETGPQGETGETGPQGEQGPQGEKGADGTMSFEDLTPEQKESLRGDQGPIGEIGPQGDQGPIGEIGPQGDQGPIGETGPQGDQGPIGETGPQGPQGETGTQGEIGETGPQGEQGPIGETGPQGPQGETAEGKDFWFIEPYVSNLALADDIRLPQIKIFHYTSENGLEDVTKTEYDLPTGVGKPSNSYDFYNWMINNYHVLFTVTDGIGVNWCYTRGGQGGTNIALFVNNNQEQVSTKVLTIRIQDPADSSIIYYSRSFNINEWSTVSIGQQGPQGDIGQTGPQGDQGPQGPAGEAAAASVTSVNGQTGAVTLSIPDPYINDTNPMYQYFTITPLTSGTLTCTPRSGLTLTLQYRTSNSDQWLNWSIGYSGGMINLNAGYKYYFKGTKPGLSSTVYNTQFGGTAQIELSGNLLSLLYGDDFIKNINGQLNNGIAALRRIFYNHTGIISAKNLVIPIGVFQNRVFEQMFLNCTNLEYGPQLLFTNENDYTDSCKGMFAGCTSLKYLKCTLVTNTAPTAFTNWLQNVSATGTFVKSDNMTQWTLDSVSGIPTGWTVLNESDIEPSLNYETVKSTTNNLKIEVVTQLPDSPDTNTIYIVQ